MVLDAKKAHFHAFVERDLRAAHPALPTIWKHVLAAQCEAVGFVREKAKQCLFRPTSRDLLVTERGDDLSIASKGNLKWAHKAVQNLILLEKVVAIGGDIWGLKELGVLSRVLRWQEWVGRVRGRRSGRRSLEKGFGARRYFSFHVGPSSPGRRSACFAHTPLVQITLAWTAPCLAFSAKKRCRRMSESTEGDQESLRRLAQYFIHSPPLVCSFPWQRDARICQVTAGRPTQ